MARRKKHNQPAKYSKPTVPTCRFCWMEQDWWRIKWACINDNLMKIAESIQKRIDGVRHTDFVEIDIPLDVCGLIALACANHNVSKGIAFAMAASSCRAKSEKKKPVDAGVMSEAVANAREELEGMEA